MKKAVNRHLPRAIAAAVIASIILALCPAIAIAAPAVDAIVVTDGGAGSYANLGATYITGQADAYIGNAAAGVDYYVITGYVDAFYDGDGDPEGSYFGPPYEDGAWVAVLAGDAFKSPAVQLSAADGYKIAIPELAVDEVYQLRIAAVKDGAATVGYGHTFIGAEYVGPDGSAIYVTGPDAINVYGGATAAYTFTLKDMPADVGGIILTFSVDGAFFSEQSLQPLNGWGISKQGDWYFDAAGRAYKEITLTKAQGAAAGDYDILEAVFNCKDVTGTTQVEIAGIEAATPGAYVNVAIAGPASTTFTKYSKYDVNRDNSVDLRDVAAAAYFYMAKSTDSDWNTAVSFETEVPGVYVQITPAQCDVNEDGVVDIEDIILILANFT